MSKQDEFYNEIASQLIEQIETHGANWCKSWINTSGGFASNGLSGQEYSGFNLFILGVKQAKMGYAENVWLTFKQGKEKDLRVKKGEKGTRCFYFNFFEKENPETGKKEKIPFLKAFTVFNVAQFDGYVAPQKQNEKPNPVKAIAQADAFVKASGADIREIDLNQAFYSLNGDFINMPPQSSFIDIDGANATQNYYGTLLHELTHWTGSKARCDRDFSGRFGSQAYAFEELVAEIGAAILCAKLGIESEPQANHAKYINTWLKVLKEKPRSVTTAFSKSRQAVEFLESLQDNGEESQAA